MAGRTDGIAEPVDCLLTSPAVSGNGSAGNPRRAQIIGIAAELFGRDGFHDTTMAVIADRAGVRKASLYYCFRSKDDILAELHQALTREAVERQRERSASAELGPRPLSAAEVADRFHALLLGGIAARAVDHPAGLPSGG